MRCNEGKSLRKIREELKKKFKIIVSKSNIQKLHKKYLNTGEISRKKGSGRPIKLSDRDIRGLVRNYEDKNVSINSTYRDITYNPR